jgi:hypothetical protein
MKLKYLALALALAMSTPLAGPLVSPAHSKAASAQVSGLRGVRRLAIGSWTGDAGFKRRLQRDMKAMGFRFVPRAQAQAVVSARTDWNRGAFTGEMWIRDKAGRTLWHESAYRGRSSNRMAGATLASSLRAALRR